MIPSNDPLRDADRHDQWEHEIDTHCPVCGEDACFFYTRDGEVIGCESCLCREDSYEHVAERMDE